MSFPVRDEYNLSRPGYWGPVTATLDWCEANYLFSHYIAEYANTWSNLVTIGFGVLGMWQVRSLGLPARFFVLQLLISVVGMGSFWFHTSLLYSSQMSDELPMILAVSANVFILFDTSPSGLKNKFRLRNNARSQALLFATIVFDAAFSYSYWLYRNPVYHQFVFGTMLLATIGRVSYLIRFSDETTLSPQTRKTIGRLHKTGALMFIFAFAIWNVDNVFCDALSGWKMALGWPTAFLLEGHAWWHCFTASGSYLMQIGTTYLILSVEDDAKKYRIKYTSYIPMIAREETRKA